ncbi:MAG: hypothetical protein Q7U85_00635 [Rhodocyclaceae bacterium]|nr:hypothetical protein [Rhodocyclaceae bacterium]
MRKLKTAAILLGMLVCWPAIAQGYYLCQDPKTGKKVGQDSPCASGKELGSYAPVTTREQKTREESAKQSKREFERLHPGTYRPEEYLSEEEYAAYLVKHKEQEAEWKKQEEQQAVRDAVRRSERAEQRAIEAERLAREAEIKAAAAEDAARNRRFYPPLFPPPPPRYPRVTNCDPGGCWDDQGQRYNKGGGNTYLGPSGPCTRTGNTLRCP